MANRVELRVLHCMNQLPENRRLEFQMAFAAQKKERNTALLLAIFLGEFGIDRFYLGQTLIGVLKLCTFGGCLMWSLLDCFLILGATDAHNNALLDELMRIYWPQFPQPVVPALYVGQSPFSG